jgi:hypothetical protein
VTTWAKEFVLERTTKNMRVYREEGDPTSHGVRAFYLSKTVAANLGTPERIEVSVVPLPEGE